MKTEFLTISKIFNEAIFRIPDYQRGYSWQESHLKDFWSDLEQLENKKSHYTGVLTLENVPDNAWAKWDDDAWIIRSKGYSPYYVVDGQQRLTTIVILIQCIIEKCECEELNYTPIEFHRRKFIYESRSDKLARSYIFGYEKDNPSREFLQNAIFNEKSSGISAGEMTVYTKNLRNAKLFFREKIANFSHDELEIVFHKLTQQFVFNAYEISKDVDVFVAFETMNNRGKPLSALELLKNRLIYLLADAPEPQYGDSKMWRKKINDAWAVVYSNLGKNENRPLNDDIFLRNHFITYYHKKIADSIPDDDSEKGKYMAMAYHVYDDASGFLLREYFTRKRLRAKDVATKEILSVENILEYASDLRDTAEVYFNLSNPEKSLFSTQEKLFLERLRRLLGNEANAIILSLYRVESDAEKCVSYLRAYERNAFCMSLSGGYRERPVRNGLMLELAKYINGTMSTSDMINLYQSRVDNFIKEAPLADVLCDWTKNGLGYYGWRPIRYFLFEYELSLQAKSKTKRNKIDWDVFSKEDYSSEYTSIEHIYPQRPKSEYWKERFNNTSSQRRKILRNSLGNLLALSKPKNASLSNKPFPQKVSSEESTVGYRFGSFSENEVSLEDEWTPKEILKRGIRMLQFMETRWGFQIGDDSQKKRALGLGFME